MAHASLPEGYEIILEIPGLAFLEEQDRRARPVSGVGICHIHEP